MNYLDLYSSYPDHSINAAWEAQVTEAAQTSWLKELLLRRSSELFPRFAACDKGLRALPRNARRELQHRIARSSHLTEIFPELLQSRALQQRLARSLAGAALLMALSQGVATAAKITVTTKDARVRPDGQCSLIEAIVNANADAAFFSDCPAGDGADTIVLPTKANIGVRDVYDITYGPTGLPLVTGTITIEGNGARIRRQGKAAFRLLAVSKTGNLTIQDVEVSHGSGNFFSGGGGGIFNNGTLAIQDSTISGNSSFGGSVLNHATLIIENSTISGNVGGVQNGGRGPSYAASSVTSFKPRAYCSYAYNYYWGGGGIYCHYIYGGALTITNSNISKNSVFGVLNKSGTVTIVNSDILSNKGNGAFNYGGVFDYYGNYIPAGDMSIIGSTISKNSSSFGGGILNRGILTIENSIISENKVAGDGGGIFNASNFNAPAGDLSLLDTTISGNRAKDSGGGLFNEGTLNVSNSTISGNKARFGADVFP